MNISQSVLYNVNSPRPPPGERRNILFLLRYYPPQEAQVGAGE
jgi:hypothetical protein